MAKTQKNAQKKAKKKAPKKPSKNTKKPAPKRGFFSRFIRKSIKWGFVLGLWVLIGVAALMAWYATELPSVTKSMVFERRPTVIIKSSNGDEIDRYGDMKGNIVQIDELPPHVVQAVLATEDRRFYKHFGFDIIGFGRAMMVNIKNRGFVQGGSTITQQLAKNLFLSRERTIKRKIQELMLSFWLEKELTKDEILSSYLNRVYLGAGTYGIDAAAQTYFGKSAKELSIRESATIAGLLKAPSRYSPASNPSAAAERTKIVLQGMVNAGYVDQSELDSFKSLPPSPRRKPSSGETLRYFTDYVVAQLDDLIGATEEDIIVETTLDESVQSELEESMTKALLRARAESDVSEGAGLFMRLDGAVVAMMGGKDYGISQFNRATDSLRPPSSAFKPFVYLAAIEQGRTMSDIVMDEKITRGRYKPANFGHRYYGEVTLHQALKLSLNTVAVNLMREVNPGEVINLTRRLGITADLEPDLSLALGSSGVPMIQMATAYATIGRGGKAVDPYAIKRILSKDGEVLYEREPPRGENQVVKPEAIHQIATMMQAVIDEGTGQAAQIPYQAAGKTGTSQEFRDAWFIGFTDRYVGAVWMGNDDNSPTKKLTGGAYPARVWKETMIKAQPRGNGPIFDVFGKAQLEMRNGFDDFLSDFLGDNWLDGYYETPADGQDVFVPQTNTNVNTNSNTNLNWRDDQEKEQLKQRIPPAQRKEYTPLGRHQFDVNE